MEKEKKKKEQNTNFYLRVFISFYIFSLILISLVISLSSQLIACVLFFPLFLYSKRARLLILGACFKYCCYFVCSPLNPFWKIRVIRRCKENYKPTRTLLIINHLSSVDPWIISACTLPWEMKFVFKSTLFRIPIAGQSLFLSGDIPIYFTKEKGGWAIKPGGKEKLMKICREYQDLNIGTAVFPEGTRSLTGQLQLFKSGFFRFAIENNCEILPCALHGTNKVWPVKSKLLDKGTMYFSFGEPFRPTPDMTYQELKDKTRNAIFDLIKEFPDYDPEKDKLLNEYSRVRGHGL
ncbi:1-acyl-sn-glycerol-3-phosphate acyltransferase, putative [Plasmodium relictum]|uniref:1-acyl-sn-glycerol-3-phosphate acyltransferase, putative n=1 Tax=Plasmodium relictum TaxID=85471 RepID=A0A1J1H991_PLARL|nr:1-acyl-sn-glycerol-3-phosphate acyltransferase, putative [Plasmodium relictum]CRH01483.1 1-acyl-sn-glycerol-3-phosphate acyltransferase, putative [Plasmodium relictum]